jgi:N-dimethylarginine dimethylaminohydrolase
MAILMCRPEHFGIEYEINPWMNVEVKVDHQRACEQWERLYLTYQQLGQTVELVEPVRGLPDMVFTANAGVVWGRKVVLSRFHHPERQGEETHWQEAFQRLGMEVHDTGDVGFEGAGDALFLGDRLFCGYGYRTERAAHDLVEKALGVEVISLELVDPRFYHLDTCFCPLDERTALFAPAAFSPRSQSLVRQLVDHLIEVPVEVAAGFACNAIAVGDQVISSVAARRMEQPLQKAGFATIGLPMTEFMKSGGGVRCLSLPLDTGSRHNPGFTS